MKDFLGNEMGVGDFIVYGASLGRCAALSSGIITKLSEEPHSYRTDVMQYRITVRRIIDQYGNNLEKVKYKCRFGGTSKKHVTLQFPDRCVVIQKAGEHGDKVES